MKFRALLPQVITTLLIGCGGGGGGDGGGNGGGNNPPADTTPPETTIDTQPAAASTSNTAAFTFSSNEPGSSFEASFDNAPFAAATSPLGLSNLADGAHSMRIRARDAAGNVDATPAAVQWTVDANDPDTTLVTTPAAATNSGDATFTFTSNETGATFEASLDGAAFATATSPLTFTSLATGAHTLAVRARDASGHLDASPAAHNWTIDVVPPTGRIVFPTRISYTDAATLTVRGTASDANGIGSVSVNGVPAVSTNGYATWRAVVPSSALETTLTVSVTDAAGNTNPSAAFAYVENRGSTFAQLRGMDFDVAGNRVIATDTNTNQILAFRAADGVASVLSAAPTPGAAPGQFSLEGIAVDPPRNRAIYLDYGLDALVAVDLATGARSVVSAGAGQASPTTFGPGPALAVDPVDNRAFVVNSICQCVIGVNLASGARSIVTGPGVGTGVAFPGSLNLVYDNASTPGTPRLLVGANAAGAAAIMAIDVATGNRSIFSSSLGPVGNGPVLQAVFSIELDAIHNRLLVLDAGAQAILAINLNTGDRSFLVSQGIGTGPGIDADLGFAYDPTANVAYSGQHNGKILSTDLSVHERSIFAQSETGTGRDMQTPEVVLLEQASGPATSLLFSQLYDESIVRLNLTTGARTTVANTGGSSPAVGTGASLAHVTDIVLDTRPASAGNAALVLLGAPDNLLVSLDLTSGDRAQIADLNLAPAVIAPRKMRLDAANNRVLFTDTDDVGDADAIYAVDLTTGARTTVSSSAQGAGAAVQRYADLVLDPANPQHAYVSDAGANAILDVDLTTGNRNVLVSVFQAPVVTALISPDALFLDSANARLIGINRSFPYNLYSLALVSKEIHMISGLFPLDFAMTGAGPPLNSIGGMAVDTASNIAYTTNYENGALLAVDLLTGDRVLIAN